MDSWNDHLSVYQDRPNNREVSEGDAADFLKVAMDLDEVMGNTDRQMQTAAHVAMQYTREHPATVMPATGVEIGGDWVAGTANAADMAGGSTATLIRNALLAQSQSTRLNPNYDYEDQLIEQWDAVIGTQVTHKSATMEQMMGQQAGGPYIGAEMHGDKTVLGMKERFEGVQQYEDHLKAAVARGAPQKEIDEWTRGLAHLKQQATMAIEGYPTRK
jgi:hypothetical protein